MSFSDPDSDSRPHTREFSDFLSKALEGDFTSPQSKDASIEALRKVLTTWVNGEYPKSALESKVFAYILRVILYENVLKTGVSALTGENAQKINALCAVGKDLGVVVGFAKLTCTVEGNCSCIFDNRDKIYDDYYYYGPKPEPVMDHVEETHYELSDFVKLCGTPLVDDKKSKYRIDEEAIAQKDPFVGRDPDDMHYDKSSFEDVDMEHYYYRLVAVIYQQKDEEFVVEKLRKSLRSRVATIIEP
ncbi:hypothetical protein BKA70DRAFT_1557752 [Coprinopsis sp. MPI-PUGE-AT-0042]|nr:hypothetical protein BKA70DRAFT_1557752 [Coprinopsis sp. MPI-PUGE-AT-0042]